MIFCFTRTIWSDVVDLDPVRVRGRPVDDPVMLAVDFCPRVVNIPIVPGLGRVRDLDVVVVAGAVVVLVLPLKDPRTACTVLPVVLVVYVVGRLRVVVDPMLTSIVLSLRSSNSFNIYRDSFLRCTFSNA